MATYLTGSNKYIPQIQPYQPDFNFYKSVLDTKNAQYEAGYNRVNSIYGTLLNSPLTRQDTAQMRNDYFSKANNEIQRIAGVDLSIEDNQRAAFQVFKPLTTNKLFAKDINFTKELYNEYDRGEFFRNCLNQKECGGKYWEGGMQYLQYKAQDFANATEQEALGMSAPKYVPFVNVVDDAVNFAINSKLQMQTTSSDGRYIYTTTNGTPMEAPLYNYFISKYGNDQQVADMYNVSAYLQRKQYGESKASEFGSTQAAEADYIQKIIAAENKANRENKVATQENKEVINAKKDIVENYIKTNGVDPELDKNLIEYYRRLNDDQAVADDTDNYYKESLDITSPTSIEGLSQNALAARADAILARGLLSKDLASAATSYSQLTQKQDVKADPIYLENLNFSHQVSLKGMEFENQWKKAAYDYANDLELKLWDSKLKTDVGVSKYEKSLPAFNSLNEAIKKLSNPNAELSAMEEAGLEQYKKVKNANEERLKENLTKTKEQKEIELEYYIHELRGHTSEQVWGSMGPEKLSKLGVRDKNDLLFLDSQEQQLADAKRLYEAKEKGATLSQSDELRANAYAMGWGTDIEGYKKDYNQFGPQIKTAPYAKAATEQGKSAPVVEQPVETNNVAQTTPEASADTTAQVAAPTPMDTTSAPTQAPVAQLPDTATTTVADTLASIPNQDVPAPAPVQQPTDIYAGIKSENDVAEYEKYRKQSTLQRLFNPRAKEFNKILEAESDSSGFTNAMLKGASDYIIYNNGGDTTGTNWHNLLRTNVRGLYTGTVTEEKALIGAVVPYALKSDDSEMLVANVDPTSTPEYKNIQIPNNKKGLVQKLMDVGLALTGANIQSENAITAGMDTENANMHDYKVATVNTLLKKYQDKAQYGNASEKKSALASIKKMFPGAARMGLIGDDGQIKNNDMFPYMKLEASSSSNFDMLVNEYEKDPMFKNDPDKQEFIAKVTDARTQMQVENALKTIDQYNIARIGTKMETNVGMLAHGDGNELKTFMDKYLFKQMGTVNAPYSEANGAPLKAVRTEEDFKKDIYSSPKTWEAAHILADAAISVTNYYDQTGKEVATATAASAAGAPISVWKDTYDNFINQNPLNPQISKSLANKANQLLGMEFSGDKSETANIVNTLNQNGIDGKELLKEAIMEVWTSEGRTTEWDLYNKYAAAVGGNVPRLEYQEIPVIGYDTFRREYGIAAADKNTDLQTYHPRNELAQAYKGQGGLSAQPYGINFNEALDLDIATGNQDFAGLIENFTNVMVNTSRNERYNYKPYILDMPYADVIEHLNVSDSAPSDWNWDQLENGTMAIQGKTLDLLNSLVTDIKSQNNLGQFTKQDLVKGQIKVYPVALGHPDMTAYQITMNGEKAKSLGYQSTNKDQVFTLMLPRYQAKNTLYKRTQNTDWVDLALWATGKATINIPGSGTVTITQDAENNYVLNGQIYSADEMNDLIHPQEIETQRANKSTLPGYMYAEQVIQQLLDNYGYINKLNVSKKSNNPNLVYEPQDLLNNQ